MRDKFIWFASITGRANCGFILWATWRAIIPFIIYGILYLYAPSSNSRWHESSHGTAFKTGGIHRRTTGTGRRTRLLPQEFGLHSADAPSLDALYDLKNDPQELNNLLGRNPDREKHRAEAARMKGLLVEWLARVKSAHLESVKARPIVDPVGAAGIRQ